MVNRTKCTKKCLCGFTLVRKSLINFFVNYFYQNSSMINPLSIGTCLAKSSLVFHNLLLTMTFYFFMSCKIIIFLCLIILRKKTCYIGQLLPFIITLCLASSISLYPIVLIAPALLQFSKNRDVN